MEIKVYNPEMQQDVENFFIRCFSDLGWDYEPDSEHSDIRKIQDIYMEGGCMWCMFNNDQLIGTVAVRTLDKENKILEMTRLHLLKEFQRKGYGKILFETALNYAKNTGFDKIYADTAKDRDASIHLLQKYGFTNIPKYEGCSQYTVYFWGLNLK